MTARGALTGSGMAVRMEPAARYRPVAGSGSEHSWLLSGVLRSFRSPPSAVQWGRRLAAVRTVPHRAVRGEQLACLDMLDLRLSFDGGSSVIACGCHGKFTLWPVRVDDDAETGPGSPHEPADSEGAAFGVGDAQGVDF